MNFSEASDERTMTTTVELLPSVYVGGSNETDVKAFHLYVQNKVLTSTVSGAKVKASDAYDTCWFWKVKDAKKYENKLLTLGKCDHNCHKVSNVEAAPGFVYFLVPKQKPTFENALAEAAAQPQVGKSPR